MVFLQQYPQFLTFDETLPLMPSHSIAKVASMWSGNQAKSPHLSLPQGLIDTVLCTHTMFWSMIAGIDRGVMMIVVDWMMLERVKILCTFARIGHKFCTVYWTQGKIWTQWLLHFQSKWDS